MISARNSTFQLRYELKLDAPALITVLSGDPNTVEGASFIPGSSLFGAFATDWIMRRHLGSNAHEDKDFSRLFLGGGLSFLNAYLEDDDQSGGIHRLLPIPLSLRVDKGNEQRVHDLAASESASQMRRLAGYCRILGDNLLTSNPRTRLSHHTQRADRLLGRSTDTKGALFAYDALDGGQLFLGRIAGAANELRALTEAFKWTTATPLTFALGRSRSAEYGGQARLRLLDTVPVPWTSEAESSQDPENWLILTLTSHLIPNPPNQVEGVTSGSFAFPIEELVTIFQNDGVACDPTRMASELHAFTSICLTGGFSSVWRLPRPQSPAFAAGSVFCFRGIQVSETQRLEIEGRSLGQRVGEGFGRFVLNWHGERDDYELAPPKKHGRVMKPTVPPPDIFVRVAVDTARQWAAEKARGQAMDWAHRLQRQPKPALLMRMASLLRDLDVQRAPGLRTQLLGLRKPAQNALRDCQGPQGTLWDRLLLLCSVDNSSKAAAIDQVLGIGVRPTALRSVLLATGADPLNDPELRGMLASLYLQAILAELRRTAKQDGEGKE